MRRLRTTAVMVLALIPPLAAQPADSMTLALELGMVLASEEPCALSFDQARIEDWIEENVPADDMSFAGTLSMMTTGNAVQIEDMTASQKAAHCAQIGRVARSLGFTD